MTSPKTKNGDKVFNRLPSFLKAYLAAFDAGMGRDEFAESIGVKPTTVYTRVYELRKLHPDLPMMKPTTAKVKGRAALVESVLAEWKAKSSQPEVTEEAITAEFAGDGDDSDLSQFFNFLSK